MLNISKKISIKKIYNIISNELNIGKNINQFYQYIQYLQDSMIIQKIEYYSNSSNILFSALTRFYAVDIGMRNALMKTKISGVGRIYENIVFNNLKQHGYDVKGLTIDNIRSKDNNYKEIDFIATRGANACNIQVTEYLTEDNQYEIDNFMLLHNKFPCYVICKNAEQRNYDGIKIINIIKYLMGHEKLV